jgi:hypothetical protein
MNSYLLHFLWKLISYDTGLFDQKSVDRKCHFSVDQNFHNQLIKFFDAFQLIEFLKKPQNLT